MAQSRHRLVRCKCPLSGVKRTWPFALQMSASDPKRTFKLNSAIRWQILTTRLSSSRHKNNLREEIMRTHHFAVVLCAAMASVPANAQDAGVLKLPQEIEFKGPLSGPPQTAVLYGDPTKPGLFVSRVKFSPGWKDPPHWHPDEARTVAVLSGTLYSGRGEAWDESQLKAYPAGTFYSEPAKAPHFSWAKDGEVVIQITGIGPSGKTYIQQAK